MITGNNDKYLRSVAAMGLALGGILGMAGSFAASDALRGLAWGIDGTALVVASALLAVYFFRRGQDLVAAGYIVFAVGQGLIVSTSAMPVATGAPTFGAGISLWAAALVLISAPRVFPMVFRILGSLAALLFFATAAQIFSGTMLNAKSAPLPSIGYPVLVVTLFGWSWSILRGKAKELVDR